MNETVKLQLSALADAELGPDELRFLLRRIDGDPGLAASWTRYHVAGECLRRQALPPVSADFALRVAQALPARRSARWLRMGMGGAIAASVAVAALMLVRPPSVAPDIDAAGSLATATSATQPVPDVLTASATNNYSLLLRDPGAARLDVEPASAVVTPTGYAALEPTGYVHPRPFWMQENPYVQPRLVIFASMPAGSASAPTRNSAGR